MEKLKLVLVLLLTLVIFIISITTKVLFFSTIWTVVSLTIVVIILAAFYVNYQLNKEVNELELFFKELTEEDVERFIQVNDEDKFVTSKLAIKVNTVDFALYDCRDCCFECLDCSEFKVGDKFLVDICSKKGSIFEVCE